MCLTEAKGSGAKKFDGKLKIDQAYINVTTHDDDDILVMVSGIDTDCWQVYTVLSKTLQEEEY